MAATPTAPQPLPLTWPGQPGDAQRLAAGLKLSADARGLLHAQQRVSEYVERLRERGLLVAAIGVLARGLSRREANWWACRCVREMLRAPAAATMDTAPLEAAERWVVEPSETHRRAAGMTAEAANYETPAACAALAAFWSEGSMAPVEAAPVNVPPHLAPGAVASAVQLAAVVVEPQAAPDKLVRFIEIGMAVAQGKDRWPA